MAKKPQKKTGRQDAPYNMPAPFERAVAFLACTNPRFLARTAHEARPELLALPECRLALDAAQAILRERGAGPSTASVVIAHCAARREAGKVTEEEVRAVAGLFDIYDEEERPPEMVEVEAELVALLRKRLRFAAAQAAVDEHGEDDWEQLQDLMRREDSLGKGESGIGIVGTPEAGLAAIRRVRGMPKCEFGISGLDEVLCGVPWGTLTCFMAAAGGAKSMTLSHIAGQLALKDLQVAYATLELPTEQVLARIYANQTGFTIDEVYGGLIDDAVEQRLRAFGAIPVVVQDFAPHVTTAEMIVEWAWEIQRRQGRRVDVLIVDYADKLTASGKADEKGMYQEMRIVYEKLRVHCQAEKILGLTASQSRGRDEKKGKMIDLEHTADSMHKARIVDQFITLNLDDESKEMTYWLAKVRYGEGRKKAGPVPTNFACGQVAPIDRRPAQQLSHRHPPSSLSPIVSPLTGALDPHSDEAKAEAAARQLGADAKESAHAFVQAGFEKHAESLSAGSLREPGADEGEAGGGEGAGGEAPF